MQPPLRQIIVLNKCLPNTQLLITPLLNLLAIALLVPIVKYQFLLLLLWLWLEPLINIRQECLHHVVILACKELSPEQTHIRVLSRVKDQVEHLHKINAKFQLYDLLDLFLYLLILCYNSIQKTAHVNHNPQRQVKLLIFELRLGDQRSY